MNITLSEVDDAIDSVESIILKNSASSNDITNSIKEVDNSLNTLIDISNTFNLVDIQDNINSHKESDIALLEQY